MTTTSLPTQDLLDDLQLESGRILVSSRRVAERFGKQHNHVMRDIRELRVQLTENMAQPKNGPSESAVSGQEFAAKNFEETSYQDANGRNCAMFHLTRDGFTLLVMGFNGVEALGWKMQYMHAFNTMEAALKKAAADRLERTEAALAASKGAIAAAVDELGAMSQDRQAKMLRIIHYYVHHKLRTADIASLMGASISNIQKSLLEARRMGLLPGEEDYSGAEPTTQEAA